MRLSTLLILSLVLAGVAAPPARSELVTDGSFANNCEVTNSCSVPPYFTFWDQTDGSIVADFLAANSPPDDWDAEFTGSGILSQNISTTAGQAYTLSFSVLDENGLPADTFTVDFGGFTTTVTGDMATVFPYISLTFPVPGSDITGTSTLLSFQGSIATDVNGDLIGGNWNLDDVSVVPVVTSAPEPPAGVILAGAVLMILSFRFRRRSTVG